MTRNGSPCSNSGSCPARQSLRSRTSQDLPPSPGQGPGWTASRLRLLNSSQKSLKLPGQLHLLVHGQGYPRMVLLLWAKAHWANDPCTQLSIWKWKAEAKNKDQWNCSRLMGWKPQRIHAWGQGPWFPEGHIISTSRSALCNLSRAFSQNCASICVLEDTTQCFTCASTSCGFKFFLE